MKDRFGMLLLVAALSITGLSLNPAWAQSSGGLQLGPADDSKLDLGAGAAPADREAPPAPKPTSAGNDKAPTKVTHGAWDVVCSPEGKNCAMAQVGNDSSGTPVLEMVIRILEEPLEVGERTAIAVLDVITPLGVVLPEGLSVKIDEGEQESAPFQVCTEQGCLVREPIDGDLVNRLKGGRKAVISVIAANQGEVKADLSLSGFTKAFAALK